MIRAVLGLGLIVGAGLLLTRQGQQGGTTTGGSPWIPLDTNFTDWLKLPDFGSSWSWSFSGSNYNHLGDDMSQPRGIRNHNPGNIEYTGTQWQGLADPPHDGRFMRFESPQYGIRAMARVLTTYEQTHGLNYIGGIIQRWAPEHENNSAAYAGFVANKLGIRATDRFDVQARMPELIEAIIQYENGRQPYSLATIRQGVAMA